MIRKHKKFSWPRKMFNSARIAEENKLVSKYGLKNKREIWKTEAKVKYLRTRAKELITANHEEQKIFFGKINMVGLKVSSIADVLALNKEDLLRRRLSQVLVEKGFATTPKQARQMITHKRVIVGDKVIDAPGYLVEVAKESKIQIRAKEKRTPVKAEVVSEEENLMEGAQ